MRFTNISDTAWISLILKIYFEPNFEYNFVLTKLKFTTRTQKEALLCWYYIDKRPKHFVVAQVIVQPNFFVRKGSTVFMS